MKPNINIEWHNWPELLAVYGGYKNLSMYSKYYSDRQEKYPNYTPSAEAKDIALHIEKNGYYKIENFLDINQIDKVSDKLNEILGDANHPYNQNKISLKDAQEQKHYIQCLQPLENVPEIHPFVFNDLIIDIAGAYLDCQPGFGTCNLRRSFVNNLEEGGTQLYHVDPNSPRFLKFFIYLDDVDENGGPFCYIEGSHTKKFTINGFHWNKQYRWDKNIINNIYKNDKIKYLTAKKGDLIMADTNGWHRGIKPINKNRTMLTLDYICHWEEFRDSRFNMKKEHFDLLEDKYKPLCDFLKLT